MTTSSIFSLASDFHIACHNCDERMTVEGFEPFSHVLCANCEADIIIPVPFGNFLLEEEFGKGNIASVYRALDYSLDREVAIKVINPEIAADEEKKNLFLLASQKAATINDPHVVKVFSTGEQQDMTYISTEFMSNGSLAQYFEKNGKVKGLDRVQEVAKQITQGLSQVHKVGLIYSDFSPNDILLDDELNAKITDVGFVNLRWDLSEESVCSPFADYFSPERVAYKELTVASDIYSLGAIFYKMVTGHVPQQGADLVEPKEINTKITDEFNALVLKMLSENPDERYQSADEILAILNTIKVNSVAKKSIKVDDNVSKRINKPIPKKAASNNNILKIAVLLVLVLLTGLGIDYARGEKSALFAEGCPLHPIVQKLKGETSANENSGKTMVITVPDKVDESDEVKEVHEEKSFEGEDASEYVAEGQNIDMSKVLRRPRPKGIDFIKRKDDLQKYVKSFPTKEMQELEKKRLVIIAEAKSELSKLMSAHPYQPDGKVYVFIKAPNNSLVKERCISVKANSNEVVVKKPKGQTIKLKWWQVPLQQIVTFYEYYLKQRIQFIEGAPTEAHKKMAHQAAVDTAQRIALLCDWYGDKQSSLKYTKWAVKLSPKVKDDMKTFLPYQFKK